MLDSPDEPDRVADQAKHPSWNSEELYFNTFFLTLFYFFPQLDMFNWHLFSNYKITRCCLCYLFTYFLANIGIYTFHMQIVESFKQFSTTIFQNLLFYWHFTNKMYIFLLIFVACVGNIKSHLTFHTIIIRPTEIFWKERSINVLINMCISFEVFLEPRQMFIVFKNEIINNFRCILVFQWQFL